MVQYTLAFGYQNTGMTGGVTGSTLNPTLGWKYFGLTDDTGIVVGNQETGEGSTSGGSSLGAVPALHGGDLGGLVEVGIGGQIVVVLHVGGALIAAAAVEPHLDLVAEQV